MGKNKKDEKGEIRQYEENPYNPDKVKPEDIVRIFYTEKIPLVPVVSRRGHLFGILLKEDVVAELSDIERASNIKIDQFLTGLVKKLTLDELLPYVSSIKEFTIINIFGEVQGKWSRIELLTASEKLPEKKAVDEDIDLQKEKQILEWMIYLILEHIPRSLCAVNQNGKTIFYNNHFEDLIQSQLNGEFDIDLVEESLKNPDKNEFFYRKGDEKEIYFFNRDFAFYYERIPLVSDKRTIGYLIYCSRDLNEEKSDSLSDMDFEGKGIEEILTAVERRILVDSIKRHPDNLNDVAQELKIDNQVLRNRMNKYGIVIEPTGKGSAKK